MVKKLFSVFFILFNLHFALAQSSPILSNFRIEDSNKNRVYFDSSEPIIGSSSNGFVISGMTISGLSIASNQTTGHYFTVSSSFNYWDNTTIRYNGTGNVKDEDNNPLLEFTLKYIENFIPEPSIGGNEYYVNANVSSPGNGLSEATAFRTIQQAINVAVAGDRVWIKSGNYGAENISTVHGGTPTNPIIYEGYRDVPGDINSIYYNYGDGNLSSQEMPLIDGGNRSSGVGLFLKEGDNNLIFKNIQFTNFHTGVDMAHYISNIEFVRVICKDFGVSGTYGMGFGLTSYGSHHIRLKECIAINGTEGLYKINGEFNMVKNCKGYGDEYDPNNPYDLSPDYYLELKGSNNICINTEIEKKVSGGHEGHAFSVRGNDTFISEYNLFDNNKSINLKFNFTARDANCKYNVWKNSEIHANTPYRYTGQNFATAGIWSSGGASQNIYENIYIHDTDFGMQFNGASNNIYRNIIVSNTNVGIEMRNYLSIAQQQFNNNKFHNITFNNVNTLFEIWDNGRTSGNGTTSLSGNEMKNCIFNNVPNFEKTGKASYASVTGFSWSYNNFFNSFDPKGTNYITADPKFISIQGENFRLQPDSGCIDSGTEGVEASFDFEGNERPQGSTTDIGAFEFINSFTGSVSPDISICNGEQTVLVASGGVLYSWSTGETSESITVNPTNTTEYSVTITDENDITETLNVTVTVEELPTVDAGLDQTICEGESVTLTATGNGDFLWSTGETTASITVSPLTTTTYSVTASNSCSTDATDEVVVNVDANVNLDAGADVSICEGESVTLSATGTGEFTWSTGETTASISVNPSSTTTYSVTATNGTCTESDEVTVSVDAPPTADAGLDQTICEGESVTLTAVGNGQFLWSTGETTASITVNPTTTTTYSVTASNSCSTDATDEVIVNVDPSVNLNAGADISICQGESATLTATGTGPFVWNTGETTASITVNPTATTTYTVTSTNGACSETDDLVVTVNTPATVSTGADQTICEGESITLTASGNGDFLWSTGETTESITVSPISTTTYSVTVSNACNTDATDEVTVTVNPGVTLDAGSDISICSGESATLTATGSGPFSWSTGETTASITVNPNSTTTYTVTADNGNCSLTDEVIVTVNTSPTVDAGSDQSICEGESVTLTASGQGDFLWSTGETTSSITVSPDETTTYSVTASTSGCPSTAVDYVDVVVSESPNLSTTNDVTIQEGESVTLNATGNGNFVWSTGETTSSITVSPLVTTSYTVTLTTDGGCSEKNTITVTVTAAIDSGAVVAYAGEDITICSGNEIILTASGGDDYLWSTGETERSIRVTPDESTIYSVRVTKGDYSDTAYVKVTIDGGCRSVEKEMVIYPNPTDGILNVALTNFQENSQLYIYSQSGHMVMQRDIHNQEALAQTSHTVDLSRLSKGIYFVRVVNQGDSRSKKVILK